MPYALVVRVEFPEGSDRAEHERTLNEVAIPAVKSLPGFQRGTWVRDLDQKTGMGIIVLDTEDNAKAALAGLGANRPPNAPPIVSSDVWEVVGQA